MKTKSRKSKLNFEEFKQSALNYAKDASRLKHQQEKFAKHKSEFYAEAEDYFECNAEDVNDNSIIIHYRQGEFDAETKSFNGSLGIRRVQNTNISFDVSKLEKRLGKKLSAQVVSKRYEIFDMSGLVSYLKECGVDPNVFKSFLTVTKSVDKKELDRLGELGKITEKDVKDCCTIELGASYFTVKVKRE